MSSNDFGFAMVHLITFQNSERFTCSYGFAHILVWQLEDVLYEKETHSILQTNIDKDTNGSEMQWPDSSSKDCIILVNRWCSNKGTMFY